MELARALEIVQAAHDAGFGVTLGCDSLGASVELSGSTHLDDAHALAQRFGCHLHSTAPVSLVYDPPDRDGI